MDQIQLHREECLEAEIRRLRQYLRELTNAALWGKYDETEKKARAAKEYLEASDSR